MNGDNVGGLVEQKTPFRLGVVVTSLTEIFVLADDPLH